jgi:hypothetical protein
MTGPPALGVLDFLEIYSIVECVTYVSSIGPIVGAPGLDFETWGIAYPSGCDAG